MLEHLASDMRMLAARLAVNESHHNTTVNLMKMLADMQGMELHEEKQPDGRIRIGWRQKRILQAGKLVHMPPGRPR